ncbi:MAG: membrane protein insertase YidC [Hyphomicrobiales bacterium]|nr:membrane protein insertase YidC [Hyphomicrobiales bacterium]MDE2115468.1 membrane protein insertase YidC [Hyphomicrobiales bacterium]
MKSDNKNLITAMVLSALVMFGWQYFYAGPQMEKARLAQVAAHALQAKGVVAPDGKPVLADGTGGAVTMTREQALAASQRVTIDTPKVSGSINLKGARLDDVVLRAYKETIAPDSPKVVLFSPEGAPSAYFSDVDYVPQAGEKIALPGPDSVWKSDATTLTVQKPVTLSFDNGQGLIFHREISIDDNYMFTIKDSVENKGSQAALFFPHASLTRVGTPKVDGYSVLFEGMLGKIGDNSLQQLTYAAIDKPKASPQTAKGDGGWLGFTDKYWASALIAGQGSEVTGVFQSIGTDAKTYKAEELSKLVTLAPGATENSQVRLFAGAKVSNLFTEYEKKYNIQNFRLMIDWGWFWFITQPMFILLDFLSKLTGSFAIAILLTTVILKAVFFPLANKSFHSMAKMKAIAPQLAAIKERFPGDTQKQQQETMEIYKREKINPVAGCLPMLIQIPVFFSLYKVLFITIEMRQAPFVGWIKDLSVPDPTNLFNLFGLLPFDPTHLPLVGGFLHLGIWPALMGFTMFLQMKMNPEPTDPVQKQMFTYMPLIFTFSFATFPAGLVIYYAWNNTLTLMQQSYIMRSAGVKLHLWDNLTGIFRKKENA